MTTDFKSVAQRKISSKNKSSNERRYSDKENIKEHVKGDKGNVHVNF